MRQLTLGLLWIALAGPLAAQVPVSTDPTTDSAVQPLNHVVGGAACRDACPPKVCVPEPTTKKVTRVVYESKCVEYCLPKCSLFGGCSNCDSCGKPRTKHILVKKVIIEECPATKCVVHDAPVCATTVVAPAARDASAPAKGKE